VDLASQAAEKLIFLKGYGLQVAGKNLWFEGYGLQPVHNGSKNNGL
jgi:hypothetical protein